MRLYFLLTMAVLVLSLSGCAKKEASSDAVANNNSSSGTNADSEGMENPGGEEGMENPGGHGDGMNDPMMDDPMFDMPEGDPMMDDPMFDMPEGDPMMDDPMFDMPEGDPMMNDPMFDMPEGDPMMNDPMFDMPEGDPMMDDTMFDMPEGDPMMDDTMFEGMPGGEGDGMGGGGGRVGGVPAKPTDIPGVKEGTPEYAAVDFILKVTRGEADALKPLIAEDVDGLLKKLRSDDAEQAIEEAKELIGQVKPQSTRGEDRDTIVGFKNNKDKIVQIFVRKIQGNYVVRELRFREAENRAPVRRRRR